MTDVALYVVSMYVLMYYNKQCQGKFTENENKINVLWTI